MKRKLPILNQRAKANTKKKCSMPFKRMDVMPNGDVYLCIKDWVNDYGPVGNLQIQSLEEIWKGKDAENFRKTVTDGSYSYCNATRCAWLCEDHEDSPLQEEEPKLPDKPEFLNTAYDLTCNLSCPSCRKEIIVDDNYLRHEYLRKKIEEAGQIKEIVLIGSGDPFSSPHARKWLRDGVKTADSIYVHTNAILLKNKWNTLPKETQEKIKRIEVSIDATTEETYMITRRGGDWDVLQENLEFISNMRKNNQIDWVKFSFVVYSENYKEMPDFVKMGIKYSVDEVYFSKVEDWGSFGCGSFEGYDVTLENHKDHKDFLSVLNSPILNNGIVRIGNLKRIKDGIK